MVVFFSSRVRDGSRQNENNLVCAVQNRYLGEHLHDLRHDCCLLYIKNLI